MVGTGGIAERLELLGIAVSLFGESLQILFI